MSIEASKLIIMWKTTTGISLGYAHSTGPHTSVTHFDRNSGPFSGLVSLITSAERVHVDVEMEYASSHIERRPSSRNFLSWRVVSRSREAVVEGGVEVKWRCGIEAEHGHVAAC